MDFGETWEPNGENGSHVPANEKDRADEPGTRDRLTSTGNVRLSTRNL
jgi:hypothetical protein